ncbi:MAG: hypothetical protein PHR60_06825 [Eubacteriales bacterium]|nr:hypothetical protein [Eubacteriales bacterium]MDD4583888.1 hypothetical protein [Eubacteriales bacterium]
MKQIIVMISMIVLGIAIASFVIGFKAPAETVANKAVSELTWEGLYGD